MPLEVEAAWFTALRRGAIGFGEFLRPAVKPLAFGGAFLVAGYGGKRLLDAYGHAANPPAQTIPIDTDADRPGNESFGIFDPRTGRLTILGQPPTDNGSPDRSNERNLLVIVGAVVGVAAIFAFTRGR